MAGFALALVLSGMDVAGGSAVGATFSWVGPASAGIAGASALAALGCAARAWRRPDR